MTKFLPLKFITKRRSTPTHIRLNLLYLYVILKLMIQNEVMVLAAVNHPGIATLHEVYQQMDKVVVIMEHV